jgi:hypothetical protein
VTDKPPLGITPHQLWIEQRVYAINAAIRRYESAGKPVPREWRTELHCYEIVQELATGGELTVQPETPMSKLVTAWVNRIDGKPAPKPSWRDQPPLL